MSVRPEPLTPELLLQAYARGYFPMADRADDPGYYWVYPHYRGILPLDGFQLPRRLDGSEARRAGKERVRTCESWWSPSNKKNNTTPPHRTPTTTTHTTTHPHHTHP